MITDLSKIDTRKLTPPQLEELAKMLTPKLTKYIPHTPFAKQAAFLLLDCKEAFYGGAAGGGKSDCLLMAALQYVDISGYRALLLRRTFQDLSLPGALMDRAKEWLAPHVWSKEVVWIEKEKTFLFPSGATITFGYLEAENDKYRYQGAEFQFIGFDELTQFTLTQYQYLFSRLRRLKNAKIPLRVRGASNPDGEGLEWVKERFVTNPKGRIFIPSRLEDNPFLDQESYEESLEELDPITRARLRSGDWDVRLEGKLFKEQWFDLINYEELPPYMRLVRYWDFASTDEETAKKRSKAQDPDYTSGLLLGEHGNTFYIIDVRRFRKKPKDTEVIVRQTAFEDGYGVAIWIEEEGGSSGKIVSDHYTREVLKGFAARTHRETGNKVLRANPVSSAAERGRIKIVRAPWNKDFLDELVMFPTKGWHDDQVDSLSGAFRMLRDFVSEYEGPLESGRDQSYWGESIPYYGSTYSENVDKNPFPIAVINSGRRYGNSYFSDLNYDDLRIEVEI